MNELQDEVLQLEERLAEAEAQSEAEAESAAADASRAAKEVEALHAKLAVMTHQVICRASTDWSKARRAAQTARLGCRARLS